MSRIVRSENRVENLEIAYVTFDSKLINPFNIVTDKIMKLNLVYPNYTSGIHNRSICKCYIELDQVQVKVIQQITTLLLRKEERRN